MTAFWIAAGLLTALVLALLCRPLLHRRDATGASRKALNAAIYRDQMAELERDLQSGVLSRDDYAVARDELERRVLEDVAADDTPTDTRRRLPRSAVGLAVLLPAAAVGLYFVLGTPAALDPARVAGIEQAPSQADIEKMVAALAAKLDKEPNNPQGWVMLGRSYRVMGRLDEAEKAFGRAGPVMESEPALMLELAELSADRNEGRVEGHARELLLRVLKDAPENPQALVIAGTDAFFRKDFAAAIRHWEKVLALVPPDSEDATNLTAGIERARAQLGQGTAAARPATATPVKDAAASAVKGRVELAPGVHAAPDDTVFIFARAFDGPRMPLAVIRTKASALPMDFTLDDSLAMSPDLRLSGAAQLRLEARVSRSGDALARPGDFTASVGPVKPGTRGLRLVIADPVK